MSKAGKGKHFDYVFTEEHRRKISEANSGKIRSNGAKANYSAAAKLNIKTHFKKGNVPYMKGRTKEIDLAALSISVKQKANYAAGRVASMGYPGFFASDLGHRVRSGWEANLCRLFSFLGVQYKYEPRPFALSTGTSYLPDFYLPVTNVFIELKGNYRGKSGTDKAEQFAHEHGQTLRIIRKPQYLKMERKWKSVIPNWGLRG